MTGLDADRCVILEIATVVTDNNLESIAEGPSIAINHQERVLAAMEEWSRTTHQASGLLDRVKASPYETAAAEKETWILSRPTVRRENRRYAATRSGRIDGSS